MELYADVILFDTVGAPYTGETLLNSGMGGSEFQAIVLLEQFAKLNLKVICLNNSTAEKEYNNVLYLPNTHINKYKFRCNNLIIHRSSEIPKIYHKKCFVWLTDLNGPHNLKFYDLCASNQMQLVTLTDFHRKQFPSHWNVHTINFIIPDWIYDYKNDKPKKDFVYASSLMKGYQMTFEFWRHLKNEGHLSNQKLHVCLPGYDNPRSSIADASLDINYLGTLPLVDVVKTIAACEGMFYVNMMRETFCISAVLCEILNTTPYIYCLNDPGALTEVLNSKTVTTDMLDFLDYFRGNKQNALQPKDYRARKVMPDWQRIMV